MGGGVVFVSAGGDLDHTVEERTFGGSGAVIIPFCFEAIVSVNVALCVEERDTVVGGFAERGVFPLVVVAPAGW